MAMASGMARASRGAVLLVDDDFDTRLAYRGLLEHAGFTVVDAGDGEEALRLADASPPDVVVLDIAIPRLDGWETARRLKLGERTRGVPVLAITGHGLDEDRRRAREVGCAGYLVKPISPPRLIAEIERLTTPAEASA